MNFDSSYYNVDYFVTVNGKRFRKDGTEHGWSYSNSDGEWLGCLPIVNAWKDIFKLDGNSKILDIGCGRGTFVNYLRNIGLETFGFDFSQWAVEHLYKCDPKWIVLHDATKPFPYSGCPFDLVIALDIFEHIYLEDIDKVIDEMFRVSKRFVFLQIATVGGRSGFGDHDCGYILKRGESAPIELEAYAVAGHVLVQTKEWWVNRLLVGIERSGNKWKFRDDLVIKFVNKVPADVISNWTKNTLLILERI